MILYGKDNEANRADPGTGVPWGNVARLTNSDGSQVGSSAVYLGFGYMLTADHVANRSHVTFDGEATWAVESGSHQQVAEDADLKVFRLSEDPGLSSMLLYEDAQENADLNQVSTVVGWGVGRDPSVAPETDEVSWGTNATREKRWGTNTTDESTTTVNGTDSLRTFLDNDAGPDEAAVTLHDSGGALFQEINGTWYLSGLAIAVSSGDESTFGAPVLAGQNQIGHSGDENYFARMATYSDDINAIIPEPSTWAMILGVGALGGAMVFRRRAR